MNREPSTRSGGYLDAIFSSIRRFALDLENSRRWLGRAEQTESQAWRLSFLREARVAYERTLAHLEEVAEQLAELGPPERLPVPLDRVYTNLTTMRADLAGHENRLTGVEAKEARTGAAIGQA